MRGLEHPLSGARYELEPDGTVTVHHQGRTGSFDGRGRWLAGELRWADPHLCGWLTAEPADRATKAASRATKAASKATKAER